MNLYENDWLYDLIHEKSADSRKSLFTKNKSKNTARRFSNSPAERAIIWSRLSHDDVEISGMDISDEMLRGAQRRAENQNIETNLINADMREFELNQKFALIFIAGNSLQHLNTNTTMSKRVSLRSKNICSRTENLSSKFLILH